MSTVKSNKKIKQASASERFARLAVVGEAIFHAGDLANLWEIKDKNTLHTTLKRYGQKGLLHRLWRGMYAIKPIERLDPILLGFKALNSYGYLSCETVLYLAGIISQKPISVTFIGRENRRLQLGENRYYCRKLKDLYLYNDVGIGIVDGVPRASVERAVADMLHYNKHFHLDLPAEINWRKVRRIQQNLGYKIISK